MRTFVVAWAIYSILILVVAEAAWIPSGLYKKMDFRAIYAAGTLARTDPSHLYDLGRQKQIEDDLVAKSDLAIPFGHLPYDALIFLPLSLLNYKQAYLSMIVCNLILMFGCFLAARKEFSKTIPTWQPQPGLILFSFLPTSIAVAQGQDSLLMLLILCLTWRFLDRDHSFVAGLVLANMLIKPHLALLVAFFVALKYGWRFIAGFAAGGVAIAATCFPFLRHGEWRSLLHVYLSLSLVSGNSNAQEAAMGIFPWAMPNLRGIALMTLGRALSSHALFIVVCLMTALAVLFGAIAVRRLPPRTGFAMALVITELAGYNLEPHDMVILLLPLVLIDTSQSPASARCREVILALPIALLVFMPSTPPGAGFALMSFPLLAWAVLLARQAANQTLPRVTVPD